MALSAQGGYIVHQKILVQLNGYIK